MEITTKLESLREIKDLADARKSILETANPDAVEPIKPVAKVKKCKVCGKELPLYRFRLSRSGNHINTCNQCVLDTRMATKQERIEKQHKADAMYDAMFVGMQPCEVLQIMGRAKKWLEARGYEIVLRGLLTVTKEVKFE